MDQERIWNHFQTTRIESFDQARGRYTAMLVEVERRAAGAKSARRVLNIGIGAGMVEQRLLAKGWKVAALDPSREAVDRMALIGVEARCGYAQKMPFDDASFDVVIASEVLEHIEPEIRVAVLCEVARVLGNGGWFVGSVPYRENLVDAEVVCPDCGKVFHRWGHVSSFDRASLRAELMQVFDEVECRRRSFVDWSNARSPMRFFKAAAQAVLGRLGEPIANPSIAFAARRRVSGHLPRG